MIADEIRALAEEWPLTGKTNRLRALADRVAELESRPCPHVVTSGGTSHCTLAERDARDAARYRWLRTRINWRDTEQRNLNSLMRYRSWEHMYFRLSPPASEHIDDYIDAAIKEQADADRS